MSSLHRACCCDPGSLTCDQWCACLPNEVHITLSIVDSYIETCQSIVLHTVDESLEMFNVQLLKAGCVMISTDGGTVNYSLSEMRKLFRSFTGSTQGTSEADCIANHFLCGVDLCATTTESGGGTSVAGDLQISCFDPCGNTPATTGSPPIAHSRLDIQPYMFTAGNQSSYGPCLPSSYNYGSIIRPYGALVGAPECLGAGTWKRFINWDIPTSTLMPTLGSGANCVNVFDAPACDFGTPSRVDNWNHNYSVTCTGVVACGSAHTCFYPGGSVECSFPPGPPNPPFYKIGTWTRTINVIMTVP